MRKILWMVVLLLSGCTFGATSRTIYPTPMPTPTLAVVAKPMTETDKESALEFFYHLKVHMLSSEYEHIAEEVRYPITVLVGGQPKTYVYVSEFSADFYKIFTDEKIRVITSTDESELVFTPEGVRVADGLLWFDYICTDAECLQPVFLIIKIN